ncbi:MAG: hypothetical protein IPJ50_07885 [Betaproteobacteria bacterium]|jgi:hypothetical protein|nr:hypothetical protein [Betaproteobacteria bacterium]
MTDDTESPRNQSETGSMDQVAKFLDDLTYVLSPHLQECFSDETKKLRNAVLALALILILLAVGAVEIANDGAFAGIKFEPKAKYKLQIAGAVVEAFLLIILAIRCYVEWSAWRLKNLSPEWSLLALHRELSESELIRINKEAKLRNELTELIMQGQYGLKSNQLSQILLESSQGKLAERQRAMSALVMDYLPKVQFARQARFWLEVLFPVSFGLFAVVSALP